MSEINKIKEALDAKIPRDVISLRDSGAGRKLSYLEGWYVINRLNEIFGQGNWSYNTYEMKLVYEGEVNGKFNTSYISKVNLEARFPNGTSVSFTDYGYGDGTDNRNPGKAHELAVKEAVTDGIKRCAKSLGMSLGLALYDKTQENVDDGKEVAKQQSARKGNSSGASNVKPKSVPDADSKPSAQSTNAAGNKGSGAGTAETGSSTPSEASAKPTREDLNMLINSASRVFIGQKRMSKEQLLAYMEKTYGTSDKTSFTDDQAAEFYAFLNTAINDKGAA